MIIGTSNGDESSPNLNTIEEKKQTSLLAKFRNNSFPVQSKNHFTTVSKNKTFKWRKPHSFNKLPIDKNSPVHQKQNNFSRNNSDGFTRLSSKERNYPKNIREAPLFDYSNPKMQNNRPQRMNEPFFNSSLASENWANQGTMENTQRNLNHIKIPIYRQNIFGNRFTKSMQKKELQDFRIQNIQKKEALEMNTVQPILESPRGLNFYSFNNSSKHLSKFDNLKLNEMPRLGKRESPSPLNLSLMTKTLNGPPEKYVPSLFGLKKPKLLEQIDHAPIVKESFEDGQKQLNQSNVFSHFESFKGMNSISNFQEEATDIVNKKKIEEKGNENLNFSGKKGEFVIKLPKIKMFSRFHSQPQERMNNCVSSVVQNHLNKVKSLGQMMQNPNNFKPNFPSLFKEKYLNLESKKKDDS